MSPDQVLLIVLASISAWTVTRVLRGPLGEALARRLGGGPAAVDTDPAEVAELRTRVSELEERLDFTERVLLQERQAGELRQGGGT
ncbi:MAG: hypothetical protein ABJC36_03730 [Gemmatimonadales bacterium]